MPYLRVPASFVLLMVSTIAGSAPPTSTNAQSRRPGDDFYSYANASWLSSVSLPAGEPSFGPTAMLKALNSERVRKLIEEAAVPFKRKRDPTVRKLQHVVGDFYTSVADRNAIERRFHGCGGSSTRLQRSGIAGPCRRSSGARSGWMTAATRAPRASLVSGFIRGSMMPTITSPT